MMVGSIFTGTVGSEISNISTVPFGQHKQAPTSAGKRSTAAVLK